MALRPLWEINDQWATALQSDRNPPWSPNTGGGGGSRRPSQERGQAEGSEETKPPGGDGEVGVPHSGRIDKLKRERKVVKGTASVMIG